MVKEEKIQQVEKLTKGFKESQAVLFADYSGLSVSEMTDLRKRLSQFGTEFKVMKNTLIRLAAEKAKLSLRRELVGPTAVLLSKGVDPIESIKTLVSAFKEKGAVKFGIFGGELFDAEKVLELAHLPARAVLEGRMVTVLVSPITKFALILKGAQRSLVTVLTEVGRVRGGGSNG